MEVHTEARRDLLSKVPISACWVSQVTMFYSLFLFSLLGHVLNFLAAMGSEKTLLTFSAGIILSGNIGYASED